MSSSHEYKFNEQKPVDLVKEFYDFYSSNDIENFTNQRNYTSKSVQNFSLEKYSGEFNSKQKIHLLNRSLVGFANRHYSEVSNLNLDEIIDKLFESDNIGEPINNYYHQLTKEEYFNRYQNEDVNPGEPFINRPYNRNGELSEWNRKKAIRSFLNKSFYDQKTSIHWKLFLFLHNLLPTESFFNDVGHKATYQYIKLLFDHCFLSYKKLVYEITLDTTMLSYLNLGQSKKEAPDENYAREVQELFTVGKRPFSKFSEGDVREIARALVGWFPDYVGYSEEGFKKDALFSPENHDRGDKQFSSFYNNAKILGKSGEDGKKELEEVIDILFTPIENSLYIARRLYQYFVHPQVSLEVEEKIIKPLAKIYRESNYSLTEPLKVLLKSEHFYDNIYINSIIKSPLDHSISLLKEINFFDGILFGTSDDGNVKYSIYEFDNYFFSNDRFDKRIWNYELEFYFQQTLNLKLGMYPLSPPSVSGWPAYYQEPMFDLFWINPNTISERIKLSNYFIDGFRLAPQYAYIQINMVKYFQTFTNPLEIDDFIDELCMRFLGNGVNTEIKVRIKGKLINGIDENHWREETELIINLNPNQKINDLEVIEKYDSLKNRFFNALKEIVKTPEYQVH